MGCGKITARPQRAKKVFRFTSENLVRINQMERYTNVVSSTPPPPQNRKKSSTSSTSAWLTRAKFRFDAIISWVRFVAHDISTTKDSRSNGAAYTEKMGTMFLNSKQPDLDPMGCSCRLGRVSQPPTDSRLRLS